MWIQVRTMDGKRSVQIDKISKLTSIEDLKAKIAEEFDIAVERHRLFFSGKQLEDGHTLFDYNVGLNAKIQVMFRPVDAGTLNNIAEKQTVDAEENPIENTTKSAQQSKAQTLNSIEISEQDSNNNGDDNNNGDSATSINSYFKANDKVDAMDTSMGAWFEASIVKVTTNTNKEGICYHVRFDDYDDNEILELRETEVRPRARISLKWDEINIGDKVMANYNADEPKERGFWYDIVVTRKVSKRNANMLYGKLLLEKNGSVSEECRIVFVDEIFRIEQSGNTTYANGNDDIIERRKVKPDCSHCKDDPNKSCKECSCHVCGGKHEPEKQIICDECDMAYHLACLTPPLENVPDEDEWYCHACRNDPSEIVQKGEKLKTSKKKQKMASSSGNCQRDWGKGMACVGRTKVCTLVPSNHFGPIPDVPVGSTWKFRLQASEAGVHRPHVSGIHGREHEGAYSIVLAGGYEDDLDNGDEFYYTGSGGRDLSGNKRTAEQSCDQKLTKMNRALAKNCNTKIDDKSGGEAEDWKQGKPVRVLRSAKFKKHSKFAPEEGVRYDGIYKIVKYWPEKGKAGFIVWRYFLRRDDQTPSPWSKDGKKLIKDLGLTIQYPEGYLEALEKKEAEKAKNSKTPSKETSQAKRKRESEIPASTPVKKSKNVYSLPEDMTSTLKKDKLNDKMWDELTKNVENYQMFLESVKEKFMCICCQEVVFQPVTTKCSHNTCKSCLLRAFKAGLETCPVCRHDVSKTLVVNSDLDSILRKLFPGYEAGR